MPSVSALYLSSEHMPISCSPVYPHQGFKCGGRGLGGQFRNFSYRHFLYKNSALKGVLRYDLQNRYPLEQVEVLSETFLKILVK